MGEGKGVNIERRRERNRMEDVLGGEGERVV